MTRPCFLTTATAVLAPSSFFLRQISRVFQSFSKFLERNSGAGGRYIGTFSSSTQFHYLFSRPRSPVDSRSLPHPRAFDPAEIFPSQEA
jgi:hypothetical protein